MGLLTGLATVTGNNETSGASLEHREEYRNEYRPLRRQLRPHTSRTPDTGPGGRQPVLSAAGAVCGGECSSAQTETSSHSVHPWIGHGGAANAGGKGVRAVASGGASFYRCGASLLRTAGGGCPCAPYPELF